MLNNKTGGTAAAAQGLAGHQSLGSEQLHCASLVLYILLPLLLFSLPFLPMSFTFFLILSPIPWLYGV